MSQRVAQTVPLHSVYGVQETGVPGAHVPPLQVPAGVAVPLVQLVLPQLVPSCPAPVTQTLLVQVVSWQGSAGWVQVSGPQRMVPPQPSELVPQCLP